MNHGATVAAASSRGRKAFDELTRQVGQLSELAGLPDARLFERIDRVSAWSVADHLCHVAKSNTAMADAIHKIIAPGFGEPARGLTLVGRAVLFTGWIPRGAGKAPEFTWPQVESADELKREVGESHRAVLDLESALPAIEVAAGRMEHFAFGGLTARQWLRVMGIHTRHHLKIIEAIQRSQIIPPG
jgi:hypothetical protein